MSVTRPRPQSSTLDFRQRCVRITAVEGGVGITVQKCEIGVDESRGPYLNEKLMTPDFTLSRAEAALLAERLLQYSGAAKYIADIPDEAARA